MHFVCGLQVLFFSTILANLVGRTLPKWKTFAITSPTLLMNLSFVKLAAAPLCFVYLKSSDRWHSDIAAAGKSWLHCKTNIAGCPYNTYSLDWCYYTSRLTMQKKNPYPVGCLGQACIISKLAERNQITTCNSAFCLDGRCINVSFLQLMLCL